KSLRAARAAFSRGDFDRAAELARLPSGSRADLFAAQGHLLLARVADRRGEMTKALEHADAGLARLARPAMRPATSDLLYPELAAERAFAVAVLDRSEEARAEVSSLAPSFAYVERARLRVGLVELARRGDLRRAARLVEDASADLALSRLD